MERLRVLDGAGKATAGAVRHDPARIVELPNGKAVTTSNKGQTSRFTRLDG